MPTSLTGEVGHQHIRCRVRRDSAGPRLARLVVGWSRRRGASGSSSAKAEQKCEGQDNRYTKTVYSWLNVFCASSMHRKRPRHSCSVEKTRTKCNGHVSVTSEKLKETRRLNIFPNKRMAKAKSIATSKNTHNSACHNHTCTSNALTRINKHLLALLILVVLLYLIMKLLLIKK